MALFEGDAMSDPSPESAPKRTFAVAMRGWGLSLCDLPRSGQRGIARHQMQELSPK
jgi:hypothetical protein